MSVCACNDKNTKGEKSNPKAKPKAPGNNENIQNPDEITEGETEATRQREEVRHKRPMGFGSADRTTGNFGGRDIKNLEAMVANWDNTLKQMSPENLGMMGNRESIEELDERLANDVHQMVEIVKNEFDQNIQEFKRGFEQRLQEVVEAMEESGKLTDGVKQRINEVLEKMEPRMQELVDASEQKMQKVVDKMKDDKLMENEEQMENDEQALANIKSEFEQMLQSLQDEVIENIRKVAGIETEVV